MCQELCQTEILPQSDQFNRLIEDLTIIQKHSDFLWYRIQEGFLYEFSTMVNTIKIIFIE